MKVESFALERWMTRHEMHVTYDIAESGICPLRMADLLTWEGETGDGALDALLNLPLGYSEARGSEALRSAIAATYRNCGPDNVLVTTGAIEANYLLFNVLLEAGDHVIAPFPAYQQLYSVPRAIGCDVSLWEVGPATDYQFDVDALERLVRPTTRLIVVNTPHNPTGAMLSPAEVERVYALAESVGAMVLGDEAYRWLTVPGGVPFARPMVEHGRSGVSVGTVSKPFGLPGLRIGWMAGPPELIAACWAARDYVSLSPGKLNDALAVLAFKHLDRVVDRNAGIIEANLRAAQDWIAAHSDILTWTPPRGGLLALLRYDLPIESLELADLLATEYSVMLAPGSAFGLERHLRIGIGQDPPVFRAGLAAAGRAFQSLRTR
ncbi:MAG: aminotransferase class I/II-fold pyridoxal phosphate-dependent enzyme [Chloroflexi bacterium]|nr:aminotransferase class I/II-fold pyridoxal phosphate-dependent enzyme [Chloroflexota bacterium]